MFNNFLLDEYLYNEPYLRNFFANIYDLFVDYKDFADAEGDPPFGDAAYLFLRYMLNTEIEKEFFDYYMFGLANNTIPPGEVHIIKNAIDQIISEIIPNATIDAGKVL